MNISCCACVHTIPDSGHSSLTHVEANAFFKSSLRPILPQWNHECTCIYYIFGAGSTAITPISFTFMFILFIIHILIINYYVFIIHLELVLQLSHLTKSFTFMFILLVYGLLSLAWSSVQNREVWLKLFFESFTKVLHKYNNSKILHWCKK